MPNQSSAEQRFGSFLHDRIKEKGLTPAKLAELANIAPSHLEHLVAENFEALPPAPYVRGYLERLGRILDFDAAAWWERLKTDASIRISGPEDELPKNRFIRRSAAPLWFGLVALAFLAYLGIRLGSILGRPALTVLAPEPGIARATSSPYAVAGTLKGGDKLFVNGEVVGVNQEGTWQYPVTLQAGLNTIEVDAEKFLGGEAKITRQIMYEPMASPAPSATSTAPAATSTGPAAPQKR